MSKQYSSSGVIAGAVIGSAVGAIAALLLAPKSGEELRSDLGNRLKTIGGRAKDLANTICSTTKEVAESVAEHTKEAAGGVTEHAKEAATSIGSHARDAAEAVQKAVKDVKSDMNSMAPQKEDIVRLGKEMDAMPTNSELESKGMQPDPKQ